MAKVFNFQSVNYPMFKVTEEEKQELIKARAMPTTSSEFLCLRVNSPSLLNKINESIGDSFSVLESFCFPNTLASHQTLLEQHGYNTREHGRKLRDIWVDKLLEFNL